MKLLFAGLENGRVQSLRSAWPQIYFLFFSCVLTQLGGKTAEMRELEAEGENISPEI